MIKEQANSRNILVEDAVIGFRNFAGLATEYNDAGRRNFHIFLSPEDADFLAERGFNVIYPKPLPNVPPEEDNRSPHVKVNVNFGNWPPKCVMIINDQPTLLDEESIAQLDTAEISHLDLVLNPSKWSKGNRSGITLYLKSLYATLEANDFELKYGI